MGYSLNQQETNKGLTQTYTFEPEADLVIASMHFHRPYLVHRNFRENFSLTVTCENENKAETLYQSIKDYAVSVQGENILVAGRNSINQLLLKEEFASLLPEEITASLKDYASYANEIMQQSQQVNGSVLGLV